MVIGRRRAVAVAAAERPVARDIRTAGLLFLLCLGPVQAQDRFIEDVQISRTGNEAEIVIRLACPMRFQAAVPTSAGALIEVRVAPFDQCRALGSGILSEVYRPIGGGLARLVEIEYESLGIGDSLLMLHFDGPIDYRVQQRADLRSLEVTVLLDSAPVVSEVAPVERAPEAVPAPSTGPLPSAPRADRAPLTSRVVEPEAVADYMINLQSMRSPPDPAIARAIDVAGRQLYVSQTRVDGQVWYRLRLGFFESESEARAALDALGDSFPRAWIGRAEPEEVRVAAELELESSESRLAVLDADEIGAAAGAVPVELSAERIAELLDQGREAMLDGDFQTAASSFTQLLGAPGEPGETARELLGVAHERMGNTRDARAQYEAYLRDFPESAGRMRVEQRLAGLVMAAAAPSEPLRSASGEGRWDWATGVSQFYRRDDNQFDEDQPEVTTLSALMSDVDLSLSRRGDRVDLSTRLSMSYMHDMLEDTRDTSQERISYAYQEIASVASDWSLRIGRQSLHSFGVLGRFDGAHFSYGWAPNRELHFTTGHPVESTRDSIETDRQFHGVAVEFEDLIGNWDVAAFLNTQTIEGIDARSAVGTEVRYFDERRTLTGMVDYDVDFSEMNSILVLGTWRFANRLMLSALFDERKSPILTTRNALIGQPVATIEEMLLVWTEEEVRQLAVDRTADSRTITLGVATPLGERFQLNFDATQSEIGATPASGGVAAIPGTGQQLFYSTSLVSTSLFKTGDVNVLSLRFGDSDTFETRLLTWDMRIPIGRRIRINPRIRLAVWRGLLDGRERETVSPTLRLLVSTRNRYRIELEVGSSRQMRTDSSGTSEATSNFVNFGYQASF